MSSTRSQSERVACSDADQGCEAFGILRTFSSETPAQHSLTLQPLSTAGSVRAIWYSDPVRSPSGADRTRYRWRSQPIVR